MLDKEIVKYYIGYVSLICRFIATQNYKSSWDLHQQKQVGLDTWQPELVSLPGTDPWSISLEVNRGRYDDGPGISQRAAAARSQTVWRWLVCDPIGLGRYARHALG